MSPDGRELDALIRTAEVVVVRVDAEHVFEATRAYRRFGKGRHAASRTFGDVFAYALARTAGEPLLFKGDDFAKTDLDTTRPESWHGPSPSPVRRRDREMREID